MSFYGVGAVVRALFRRTSRPVKSYLGLTAVPEIGKPTVWIHAVSMGETRAVVPLVQRLREEYPELQLLVSSVTETGHAEAKRCLPDATCVYLPLDLPVVMRRAVARVKPDLLLLSETDYWPALFTAVKRAGGQIVVANGKLSRTSSKWHRRFPWLTRRTLDQVDAFCLQSDIYRRRLEALGIPTDRIQVTGNLKFDALPEEMKPLDLELNGPVIVAGSTHAPEEEQLLRQLSPLLKEGATLVFVPRHPQRFDEVAALVASQGVRWGRYSDGLKGDEQIVVVDAMGLLLQFYQMADVAIVAGSFTDKVGGHNVLEPMWFGVPTLFGPHMESQANMADLVLEHSAGRQVSMDGLAQAVRDALVAPEGLRAGGKALLAAMHGSVDRTWNIVKGVVAKRPT